MAKYEDTIKDIEKTLGIVPGFMKALPEIVLIQEWPLFKKYNFEETEIPAKYRELMGLAVAANIKCPYCNTARWSTIIHAQNYDLETFKKEFEQIGKHLQKMMKK